MVLVCLLSAFYSVSTLQLLYLLPAHWENNCRILDSPVVFPVSCIVSLSSDVSPSDAQNGVADRHSSTPRGVTTLHQYLDPSRTKDTLLSPSGAKVVTPCGGASQALYHHEAELFASIIVEK